MLVKILLLVCFAIALLIIFLYSEPEADSEKGNEERVDTFLPEHEGKNTICQSTVVPTPDFQLTSNNMVYCASFQLAWQALKGIIDEDIVLTGQPHLVEQLNQASFNRESLSPDDYYVNFGFGKEDILTQINNDLIDRFGSNAPDKINMILRPEDMIIYAYIFKNLKFEYAFDKLEQPIYFQSKEGVRTVKGYGINSYRSYRHQHLKNQVEILYYKNQDDFVIGLNTSQYQDEYLMAKIKPGATLGETYQALCEKIALGKKDVLKERDSLIMPYIDIDITRKYNEIINRPFLNASMKGFYMSEALQNIKFSAGEKGAVVSSEAKIIFSRETVWDSRQLIFNGPFMIALKRRSAPEPYLLIWINNAELLKKVCR